MTLLSQRGKKKQTRLCIYLKKKTVYMDIQIQITSQMASEYAEEEFKPKTHSHCKLKDNMHNMYYIIMCKGGKEI